MDEAAQRLGQLKATVNQKILPPDFDRLSCSVVTPLVFCSNQQETSTREARGIRLSGFVSDFAELLRTVLRHLTANPSKPGNVEAYETIYTFPPKRQHITEFDQEYYPNLDPTATTLFVNKLIQFAHQGMELRKKVNNQLDGNRVDRSSWRMWLQNNKIALLGYKGVGKTTFLNYVITAHSKTCDDAKVIMVRIDLTKPYMDIGLSTWYRWQFCDILFRYYDRKKLGVDLSLENEKLTSKLVKHYHGDPKALLWEYSKARHMIEGAPEPVEVPEWVFEGIVDHLAADLNIGFIFVFDGLDKLGLTKDDQKEFNKKVKAVRSALLHENVIPAAYVVTMRWQTFLDIGGSDPYRSLMKREILRVPTELIFENKIRRLEKRYLFPRSKYPRVHATGEVIYRQYAREAAYAFLRFVAYSLSSSQQEILDAPPEKLCEVLEDIFGPDTRSLFEALESLVSDFMYVLPSEEADKMLQQATDQELLGTVDPVLLKSIGQAVERHLPNLYSRAYMVIEDLMLGPYAYHHPEYWHFPTFKEDHIDIKKQQNREKTATIMNVFYYPHSSRRGVLCLFAGVRVLQYVSARTNVHTEEVSAFLSDYFGYPKYVTEVLIEDMIHGCLIAPLVTEEHEVEDEVRLTRLGEFVLNKLSNSLEYIGLVLETAPVPADLLKQGAFPIASYNRSIEFVCNNKVVSAVNFVRLLKDLENLEQRTFNMKSVARKPDVSWKSFAIADRIAKGVFDGITGLVKDAYTNIGREALKSALEEVPFRNPSRYFLGTGNAPSVEKSQNVGHFGAVMDQDASSKKNPEHTQRALSEFIRSALQNFYISHASMTIEEKDKKYESSFDGIPRQRTFWST